MQTYKRKSSAGLAQLSAFRFWKAIVHCAVLHCLWGFPEFILEDTAYLLQKGFLFLLNNADACAMSSHQIIQLITLGTSFERL